MTNADSTPNEPLEEATQRSSIDHALIENETSPDECLLFPRNASERELLHCWIVASEGGFVSLESAR